jgi:hypothetical protein
MVVSLSGADAFKGRLDGNIPGQSGYMLKSPFIGQSAGKAEKIHCKKFIWLPQRLHARYPMQ